MVSKQKMLSFIWSNGGGYFKEVGDCAFITKYSLDALGISLNANQVTVERTVRNGSNIAILKNIAATRNKVLFYTQILAVVIGDKLYNPVDMQYRTEKLPNGLLVDHYNFMLIEVDSIPRKKKTKS